MAETKTTTGTAVEATKAPAEIQVFRQGLEKRQAEYRASLPAHIPVERFTRVILTAVAQAPELLRCDRASLFVSAMKAASDGLLPDGREGALVAYKGVVQWLPMVAGIRKKARNSGQIADWSCHAVFERDEFSYALGDEPFIKHVPYIGDGDRGKLIAVYSIAKLKGGEVSRDVMSAFEVEKIRSISRAANGPWSNPIFYPEMAKKTVARRHAKQLPMSSDLDDLIRRDDELYDLGGASDRQAPDRNRSLAARLDAVAGPTTDYAALDAAEAAAAEPGDLIDNETGEILNGPDPGKTEDAKAKPASAEKAKPSEKAKPAEKAKAADAPAKPAEEAQREEPEVDPEEAQRAAYARGREARNKGMSRKAMPGEFRGDGREPEAKAWEDGWGDTDKELAEKPQT